MFEESDNNKNDNNDATFGSEEDDLNDETFGNTDIDAEFDFEASNQAFQNSLQRPENESTAEQSQPEAPIPQRRSRPGSASVGKSEEDAFIASAQNPMWAYEVNDISSLKPHPSSSEDRKETDKDVSSHSWDKFFGDFKRTQQISIPNEDEKKKRRAIRAAYQSAKTRYDGFMTLSDKTFIARMQRSQLENGGNLAFDDYYNRSFKETRAVKDQSHLSADLHNLVEKASHGVDAAAEKRKHASIQNRLATMNALQGIDFTSNEDSGNVTRGQSQAPRRTKLQASGALGTIALTNIARPKELIKIRKVKRSAQLKIHSEDILSARIRSFITEEAYKVVMRIESLFRSWEAKDVKTTESADAFKAKYDELRERLWSKFAISDALLNRSQIAGQTPIFVQLISSSKFRKLIPRLLRHLSSAQRALALFRLIALHMSSLPGEIVAVGRHSGDELEEFLESVIGSFIQVLGTPECTLSWVQSLLEAIIANGDIAYVSGCKAGCILLTLLVSKGELLRNATQSTNLENSESTNNEWESTVQSLVNCLQGHFALMFPPESGINLAETNIDGSRVAEVDHVWSFFAALASASSQAAVTITVEVKDNILQTIMDREKDPQALESLNSFLKVMGLSDSMVMS